MSVRAKIERLERAVPVSPEARRARFEAVARRDAVLLEMSARYSRHLTARYGPASEDDKERAKTRDPLLRALETRFNARWAELEAGAAPAGDLNERVRRMFHHLPPLDWAGPWPIGEAA